MSIVRHWKLISGLQILLCSLSLYVTAQTNLLLNGDLSEYKLSERWTYFVDTVNELGSVSLPYWEHNTCMYYSDRVHGYNSPAFIRIITYTQLNDKEYRTFSAYGILCRTLEKSKKYKVSLRIKCFEYPIYANALAITFTDQKYNAINTWDIPKKGEAPTYLLPIAPAYINPITIEDTGFIKLEFTYTATGNENYMYIGNPSNQKPAEYKPYKNGSSKIYHYSPALRYAISDMWVTPIDSAEEGCPLETKPVPVTLSNTLLPDTIVLQTIYYENDKYLSNIRIDKTIEALKQYPPDAEIIITGHTDKEGSEQRNWELSELRAKAIGGYVQRQLPNRKITYKGYGYSRPIEHASPSPINRRVDICVID